MYVRRGPRCTCLGGGRGAARTTLFGPRRFPLLGRLSDIADIRRGRTAPVGTHREILFLPRLLQFFAGSNELAGQLRLDTFEQSPGGIAYLFLQGGIGI
jgi:hypothetical protein